MPATEVDLRTIDTYFEPSSFVLSKEKSGEVKPKIKPKVFRVITISDSMEEGFLNPHQLHNECKG